MRRIKMRLIVILFLCSVVQAATITSKATGNWSAGGTWDSDPAIPVNGDDVVIAAGHTVTFDVDTSGMANGIAGVTINATGELTASTSAGTYYLKLTADITNNGTLSAGSSGTDYPQTCTFTIDFTSTANSIECGGGGVINFYCTEPTNKFVKITAQEPVAETIMAVDPDVTGDIWAVGDEIEVSEGGENSCDTEAHTINAIAAGTITLNAGLAADKESDSFITLVTRNIRIINGTDFVIDDVDGSVINCSIYDCTHGIDGSTTGGNTIGGAIKVNEATGVALKFIYGSTVNAAVAGSRNGLSYCYETEFSSSAVMAGCYYSAINCRNMVLRGSWCGSQYSIYDCSSIALATSHFKGYYTAIYKAYDIYLQDCTIDTGLQVFSTVDNIVASGCTFQNNTRDLSDETMNGKFYNCSFDSATEFNNYNSANGRGKWNYVESNDHDGTTNAYKAWCVGGVVSSQTTSPPTGYTTWYEHACEDTTQTYPCFRQYETVVQPGTAIEVEGKIRIADGEDLTGYAPTLEIIDKYADPLVDSTQSALDSDPIPDPDGSETGWQDVSVIWANTGDAPRTVLVRMRCEHDGGGDDVDVDECWSIADYKDQINTLYTNLIPVKTDVATADTTTSFTLTGGTATADIYNNMTVMVQDADDDHWELRSVSDWTAGKVITVDTAFGFTPAADDLVYIMGTSYGAPTDNSAIADAVWDEAVADHTTETTFGGEVGGLDPNLTLVLADTDELQTDWTNGGRLDVILDAIKYKTDLISLVDTTVKGPNDTNNFTIEDGTDVNDAYWFLAIIVEDADGNSSKEIRWIDRYDENSGDPNVWVDEPFSFTPALNDVVHIMGTCYGGYLDLIYDNIRQGRGVINYIDGTGGSSGSSSSSVIWRDESEDGMPGI